MTEDRAGTIKAMDAKKEKLTVDFDNSVAGGVTAVVGFDNVKPEAKEADAIAPGAGSEVAGTGAAGTGAAASSAEGIGVAVAEASACVAHFPQFAFLEAGGRGAIEEVVTKWEAKQSMTAGYEMENCIPAARSQITLALDLLHEKAPKFGEKDFVVARRAGKLEVWTLREFAKNSLVLIPYSREMKDLNSSQI